MHHFIEETDIRVLVFAPPIMGFILLLIGMLVIGQLTSGNPYPPITDILLGIVFLFPCFSGYAEIYKKEMPGPFGNIYKGNWAVVSGTFIIILSSFFGISALIHGTSTLLSH